MILEGVYKGVKRTDSAHHRVSDTADPEVPLTEEAAIFSSNACMYLHLVVGLYDYTSLKLSDDVAKRTEKILAHDDLD